MEKMEGFLRKLHHLVLNRDVEDVLNWKNNKKGSFFVRSHYHFLIKAFSYPFPWSIIWRSWAPMRVSFFAWETSWNRILTIEQLKRRSWNMSNRCYFYKVEEETSDHLILFCKKVTMLWSLLFSLFDVQWVLYSSIKRNLIGWHSAFVSKRNEKAWRATPLCLMWTLWKERNERVFNDTECSDQALKHFFFCTLLWIGVECI